MHGKLVAAVVALLGLFALTASGSTVLARQAQRLAAPTGPFAGSCTPVEWTAGVNVTPLVNTLTKSGGVAAAWDAGAVSTQTVDSGDVYADVAILDPSAHVMFGLSSGNSDESFADIDFAAYAGEGVFQVYESGSFQGSVASLAAGDRISVAAEGGVVRYYLNNSPVYTSTASTITYPLLVDSSIADLGAAISDAQFCVGTLLDATPTDTPTATGIPAPTDTPTETPTDMPTETATATEVTTETVTVTPTETPTEGTPTETATVTETTTPTETATITVTPTPTVAPCFDSGSIAGSITSTDPAMNQRLNRNGVVSTCAVPKPAPNPVTLQAPLHYDTYVFTNTTGLDACFTISVNPGTCLGNSGHSIFSMAYLDSFDPANPTANYLGDIGSSPMGVASYSVNVPAGHRVVVVVHGVDAGASCGAYSLRVSTCQPPPASCLISFSDVRSSDFFYNAVQYLYCNQIISGYADNTFRPFANATRGQLAKIVVLAEGWTTDTSGGPHFLDVPTTNPFYDFIETAYNRQIISGYADGTFRWNNTLTRGQLSKIIVLAEGWPTDTTGGPHFVDVPATNAFYDFIETAYNRQIISGYNDNTFRWNLPATRGQISKIVYQSVTAP